MNIGGDCIGLDELKELARQRSASRNGFVPPVGSVFYLGGRRSANFRNVLQKRRPIMDTEAEAAARYALERFEP